MIPPKQFYVHVIAPVQELLGKADARVDSLAARRLLLGTAVDESGGLAAIAQKGGGPALSFFQIEPATYHDVVAWADKHGFGDVLAQLRVPAFSGLAQLPGNPLYACAIARLKYFRVPEPLPAAGDLAGMGRYYKTYYNTALGKGSAAKWERTYRRLCMETIPDEW